MSMLKDLVTLADGETHDIGRWFAVLAGGNGLFLAAWDVIHNGAHFDAQAYGIGMGALAAGVGAFLNLKAKTEPQS
jgi:hypothetical protein